jgi:DNA-binding LacI/PurR family transcriptional regulator
MPHAKRDEAEPGTPTDRPTISARRPPTSVDVARQAGVSQATVSYVLNDLPDSRVSAETRARVLTAADELGYTAHAMARSLRAGHSNIILLPQHTIPTGPMMIGFYEQLAARLGRLGYATILHLDATARGVEAARSWASLRPAGLLVEAHRVSRRSIELLRIAGTRAILVMGETTSRLAPTLVNNDSDVGACAAEHLVATGHRQLAILVPREAELQRLAIERLKGFERVARAHDIPVEQVDLAHDEVEAAQLAARWKRASHPTGFFAYNDEYAMLVMQALHDAGFAIPNDIALVGADDLRLCMLLRPRLTSVHKEDGAGIDAAAAAFHALIQGTSMDVPSIRLLQPRIVVRESA